ncbi:MAG: hypothetical protein GY750_20790 [Lentisphaerae bacterium]|nr:hypothetical protein [Lentisphaerota bacterium]
MDESLENMKQAYEQVCLEKEELERDVRSALYFIMDKAIALHSHTDVIDYDRRNHIIQKVQMFLEENKL